MAQYKANNSFKRIFIQDPSNIYSQRLFPIILSTIGSAIVYPSVCTWIKKWLLDVYCAHAILWCGILAPTWMTPKNWAQVSTSGLHREDPFNITIKMSLFEFSFVLDPDCGQIMRNNKFVKYTSFIQQVFLKEVIYVK